MNSILNINYNFKFKTDVNKSFKIKLDSKTLNVIKKFPNDYDFPKWTFLDNNKCSNCKLSSLEHRFCPIAINLIDIVDFFKDKISYETATIIIETNGRKYEKETSIQEGLSSIIGIYMVTSGCPIMQMLKPMVRHHLPFASIEETNYRVISMYLLSQYFVSKNGGIPDWNLSQLVKIYEEIKVVNLCFCERLRSSCVEDASINAMVILDTFADFIPFSINENLLDELQLLFNAYL